MKTHHLFKGWQSLILSILLCCALFNPACTCISVEDFFHPDDEDNLACNGSDIPCFELSEVETRFIGEETGARLGVGRAVGDINGDGFDDILTGISRKEGGDILLYLFYGRNDKFLGDISVAAADARFVLKDPDEAIAGITVAEGDVNGDGFNDILFGISEEQNSRGTAYLFYGNSARFSGEIFLTDAPVKFVGENEGDNAFDSMAANGDVNHDGYDDILTGAPGDAEDESNTGAVYLVYGQEDDFPAETSLADADVRIDGDADMGGDFGSAVIMVNDLDRDGYDDFMIRGRYPTFFDFDGVDVPIYFISLFLFYGGDLPSSGAVSAAEFDAVFTTGSLPELAGALAGDFNGDGFGDILMTVQSLHDLLFYGNDTRFSGEISVWENAAAEFGFAYSTAFGGDVNGDGFDDILASYEIAVFGTKHDIYLFSGKGELDGNDFDFSEDSNLNYRLEESNSPTRSFLVSFAGDVNGDGFDDFFMGNSLLDVGGQQDIGVVYLVYGNKDLE